MLNDFSPSASFDAVAKYVSTVLTAIRGVPWRVDSDGIDDSYRPHGVGGCFATLKLFDGAGHALDLMRIEVAGQNQYFVRAKSGTTDGFMMHPFDPVDHAGFCKIITDFEFGVH